MKKRLIVTGSVMLLSIGLGINILTTARGVMTGRDAHKTHVGGEILCRVW